MANSSNLIKTLFHKTIAEAVYREILSNSARYYYFLGKTLAWSDEYNPPFPTDDISYEKDTRDNIITLKQLQAQDVSFVVNRINWTSGNIYDQYDDQYSTQVLGINLLSGGDNYLTVPTVTIDPPDQAGGIQATGTAVVYNNSVVGVTITANGMGYTNPPKVTIVDPTGVGTGATAVGTIGKSANGYFRLEDSQYYVITSEYNVYKCLDNNNGAPSMVMPTGTSVSPISLSDGYVWKYLFNIPIALRIKFLTDSQFPVVTALNQQFYSNGGLNAVTITNPGSGYTNATLTVQGDGYQEADPVFLSGVLVTNNGANYLDGDTISISAPVVATANWAPSTEVFLGNVLHETTNNNYYRVIQAGTTSTIPPAITYGTTQDGTAALQFIGQTATAFPSFGVGGVTSVTITNGGSLYTAAPTVTFSAPVSGGTTATGHAVLGGGSVSGVVIDNPGSGYTYAPTVTFTNASGDTTGNGAAATAISPAGSIGINLLGGVQAVDLTAYGTGYTSAPTVTFSAPSITFNGSIVNTSSETITIGAHWFATGDQVLYNNGGGTTIGGLVNNTVYYVIKVSSTIIKLAASHSDALAGNAINLTAAGVGVAHTIANTTNIAQGIAVMSPTGVVQRITITNVGKNYTTPPTVTIGTSWTASTAVTLGQQFFVNNRLYTVTTAGTTGSTAPTGTGLGTAYADGTAYLTYVGAAAKGIAALRYGSGYSGNPVITINSTHGSGFVGAFESIKSEAQLIPIIVNGQITDIRIDNPGVGYSTALITVTGDGSGASVVPNLSVGNIETLQANNELLSVPGTIDNFPVISGGYGYGTANVVIEGDGTGAAGTCVIDNGVITKINVSSYGSGYTYANVTINGNGYGAEARAVVSPYLGDGKDAYSELYATTLMFYSNVSLDTNQGFTVNNDYRQVGIIKNIRKYNSTNRFDSVLGSACWVISGTYDVNSFKRDMILRIQRGVDSNSNPIYKEYIIVSVNGTGTSMLVQSLNNDVPAVSDVIYNPNNQFFSISGVGAPTADKYTGDLLYIDNIAAFTPSQDETVTLRTVITF